MDVPKAVKVIQEHMYEVVQAKIDNALNWAQRKSNKPIVLEELSPGKLAFLCFVCELIEHPYSFDSFAETFGILATKSGAHNTNWLIDDFDFDDDDIIHLLSGLKRTELAYIINTFSLNEKYKILHLAASTGKKEMAEYVIKAGVDVNCRDKDGQTALHVSAGANQIEMTSWLLENEASAFIQDKTGDVPFDKAINQNYTYSNDFYMANLLFPYIFGHNYILEKGCTRLHLAVKAGDIYRTRYLVKFGGMDLKDEDGSTVLHIACEKNFPKIVELLIINNARLTVLNGYRQTAIDIARKNDFREIICILNSAGKD